MADVDIPNSINPTRDYREADMDPVIVGSYTSEDLDKPQADSGCKESLNTDSGEKPTGTPEEPPEEKQCRICLDGEVPELGRLIRPCLCKGSISLVHVKCLHRWRSTSSQSAFYSCPQCKYQYRFARTQAVGIATNPVIIGAVSALFFSILVFCCSFLTTGLISDQSESIIYGLDTFRDMVRTTINVIVDESMDATLPINVNNFTPRIRLSDAPPGFLRRLLRRFILGLPVVGAGQVLFTLPVGFRWLRLYSRGGRRGARDVTTIIVLFAVIAGIIKAIIKVYQLTETLVRKLLLRAEDAILEVQ